MRKSRKNPLGLNEGNIRRMERHHAALAYHCAYIGDNRHVVIEGPARPRQRHPHLLLPPPP